METREEYIGKVVKDTQGKEYHINSVLNYGGQRIVYKTAEGYLLKIKSLDDQKQYRERYEWLIKKGLQLSKKTRILFPIAILEEPYVGYVMKEVIGYAALESFVEKPEETDNLWDWYFKETGGLTKRLQIGYLLAQSLIHLHINGYSYVDISPHNILVCKEKNTLKILDSDNTASVVYKPLIDGTAYYKAPEITNKVAVPSSFSDTYSYAIVLFKVLTTCHPFIGDEAEDNYLEDLQEKVDSGKMEYIGNPASTENKNSSFENMKEVMTDELKELFRRTFVDGKLDSSKRPTLTEFMKACMHARNLVIQCDYYDCNAEYYYTDQKCICPRCKRNINNVYLLSSKTMINSHSESMSFFDGNAESIGLPALCNNISKMAVTKGMKFINKSFFDENISLCLDSSFAAVARTKNGKLAVLNLSSNRIVIKNTDLYDTREVLMYNKGNNKYTVIDEKPEQYVLFIDNNIDFSTDNEYIETDLIEEYYGSTEIIRNITIKREGNQCIAGK